MDVGRGGGGGGALVDWLRNCVFPNPEIAIIRAALRILFGADL